MNSVEKNIRKVRDIKVSVVGLGRSGVAIAKLAHHLGSKVFVSDNSVSASVKKNFKLLKAKGINGEIGENTDKIYDAKWIVISPGVAADSEIVLGAKDRGIKVIGEIEFASLFTNSPIIGVTGSNGKSTTVHALVEMCQTVSVHGILAGNIGFAFSERVLEELQNPISNRVYILEISSFQMEFIEQFHPFISIFLNVSPDHLDRHKTFENYLDAKLRLAKNQSEGDFVIYNSGDRVLVEALEKHIANKITFGPKNSETSFFSVNDSNIINKEYATLVKLENIGLPGQHNINNLLAAASGAHCLEISDAKIAEVMQSFKGIPHRLEYIAKINGIEYINDSKATNIDAVKVAIESYKKPINLILGGLAKGNDFAELITFENKVKHIFAYGDARDMITNELSPTFDISSVESLQDAVKISSQKAASGDIVLLSPGCASFDQFKNFEDRGIKFTQWVKELRK